jgi:signal transduction histidine kinase
MVRELLFNVVKHAEVAEAHVTIKAIDDPEIGAAYQIDVLDEGAGLEPDAALEGEGAAGGRGLLHIRERLRFIGGRLELDSAPGRGTRATIVAPPQAEGAAGA